jgi:hypothetical protein
MMSACRATWASARLPLTPTSRGTAPDVSAGCTLTTRSPTTLKGYLLFQRSRPRRFRSGDSPSRGQLGARHDERELTFYLNPDVVPRSPMTHIIGPNRAWLCMTPAGATDPRTGNGRRAVRWMLLNRRTGRLTVAQWPNISLSVFIALTLLVHIWHPRDTADDLIHVSADVASGPLMS